MSPDILIRAVSPGDAEALRDLRLEALRLHPVSFSADLAEAEARPPEAWRRQAEENGGAGRGVILLAVDGGPGGTLAGMAGVYTPREPKLAHCGVVWGVYVRRPFRRRGVGRGLITACADWARGRGLVGLKLSAVNHDEGAAVRRYERCGFTAYGVEPFAVQWDGRLYDEVLMSLRL